MGRTFEDLVALDGRATEERPSWGYQRMLSQRLATLSAALDIHTGGGEVLAGAGPFPAHHGGDRNVAAERGAGNQALASAGRGGRGDPG